VNDRTLIVAVSGNHAETALELPPVPEPVTWDILAYNLCCLAARAGDEARLLTATRRALELGKSPNQFRADADFVPFLGHAAWTALLAEYE
jgi:hypothetical protein